jgi:hypothetical protein
MDGTDKKVKAKRSPHENLRSTHFVEPAFRRALCNQADARLKAGATGCKIASVLMLERLENRTAKSGCAAKNF